MSETRSGITESAPAPMAPYVAPPRHSHNLPFAHCRGCGVRFKPVRHNQTRCKPNCRRARASDIGRTSAAVHKTRSAARQEPKHFIAIDGEGVTDQNGEHRYVMLRCGEHYLANDGAHLHFGEILEFLWSCFEADYSATACPAYVGFYLGYDWGQWLRSLPEHRARMLLDPDKIALRKRTAGPHRPPFPVRYEGWEFDYLPGKRFQFRPEARTAISTATTKNRRGYETPWCYVCDVGSYFQSSFLKAINPHGNPNAVCTQDEYNLIADGKIRRQSAEFDAGMIEYNRLECEVLARLMRQLAEGMAQEALRPQRTAWHGPGQLAQLWMGKIKTPKGAAIREAAPQPVRDAARGSYYGGWFEVFHHGPVGPIAWGYDVNSAYPYIMSRMPCLLHGTWHHTVERDGGRLLTWAGKDAIGEAGELAFMRAEVSGGHPLVGAMLHRNPSRTILRPRKTAGWYVAGELAAALRATFIDKLRLFETWRFEPGCDCPPPLAPLTELYNGRLAVGKATPAGQARKLVYNSVAGKLQQSVGEPAYANPIYATLITSGCRSLICDAIHTHPRAFADLLMVATDGVVFKSRHPALELDPARLGAWSETPHENLSLFMPGVYWDDASRERIARGEAPVFKSRGIAAKDLAKQIPAIDKAWAGSRWPKMTLNVSFQLVSPKQALARGKWDTCGMVISADNPATWIKGKRPVREISADPKHKRIAHKPGPSRPYATGAELWSLPYDGTFGDELRVFMQDQFGDSPDGPPDRLFYEALLGN